MKKTPPGVRTWIEIDAKSLFFNLNYFRRRAGTKQVMAMIKSNAYGHGLVTIAKLLAREKDLWFGVDSITEALGLRRRGIKNRILVLGYTLPERLPEAVKNNISITISNFEALGAVGRMEKRPAVHLKIDTGMHRQGFQEADLPRLLRELQRYHLRLEGIYSHLAMPQNRAFSRRQQAIFERMANAIEQAGISLGIRHFNKTEGIVLRPRTNYDMVRIGIGLYGYFPRKKLPLKPVMTWKTIVSEVKHVPKGDAVSYDLTEKFRRNSKIAILPIGYWHGFDRGLSSVGEVLIRGKRARVVGRVTMDMTMVDVTNIPGVRVGDEAVIIGRQGRQAITAEDIEKKLDTSFYEIITRVNPLILKVVK